MIRFEVSAETLSQVIQLAKSVLTPKWRRRSGVRFTTDGQGLAIRATFAQYPHHLEIAYGPTPSPDAWRVDIEIESLCQLATAKDSVSFEASDSGDIVARWRDAKRERVTNLAMLAEPAERFGGNHGAPLKEPRDLGYSRAMRREVLAVSRFVAKESTRFALHGVYFDPAGDVVATDGFRLAISRAAVRPFSPVDLDRGVILSCDWLAAKMFDDDAWEMAAGEEGVYLRRDALAIRARRIEGLFPRWRDVVETPTEDARHVTLTDDDTAGLLAQSEAIDDGDESAIRLWVAEGYAPEFSGKGIAIDCRDSYVSGQPLAGFVKGPFWRDLLAFARDKAGCEMELLPAQEIRRTYETLHRIQAKAGNRVCVLMPLGDDNRNGRPVPADRVLSRTDSAGLGDAPTGGDWWKAWHAERETAVAS